MNIRNVFRKIKFVFSEKVALPDVCIKDTGTKKGRGVFAVRDFQKGETVEETPVIVLETPYALLPKDIQRIVFQWDKDTNARPNTAVQAVALGYGSLYNHANPANLRWELNWLSATIRFTAIRFISDGEELTVNYDNRDGVTDHGQEWWFEDKKIARID